MPLYAYVFELVSDEQSSLDIVQESFINAARYIIWAGMAVVWFVLLVMNLAGNGLSILSARTARPMSAENLAAWRQQRQFMPQLSRTTDADLVAPKPRSGGRSEILQEIVTV